MGQQAAQTRSLADSYNWKILPQGRHVGPKINPYAKRTLLNTFTSQHVQQYELSFNTSQELRRYQLNLDKRKEVKAKRKNIQSNTSGQNSIILCPYIYRIKYFIKVSQNQTCIPQHRALLYITKVDLRLKQINQLTFSDQIYLTKATLQGFKCLYQAVGYFDIIPQMIFISKNGKVRVWINPNLSSHEPYCIKSQQNQKKLQEARMVINLMSVIDCASDNLPCYFPRFQKLILGKGLDSEISFFRALKQFNNYCQYYNFKVQDRIQSIYELFDTEQYAQLVPTADIACIKNINSVLSYQNLIDQIPNSTIHLSIQKMKKQQIYKPQQPIKFQEIEDNIHKNLKVYHKPILKQKRMPKTILSVNKQVKTGLKSNLSTRRTYKTQDTFVNPYHKIPESLIQNYPKSTPYSKSQRTCQNCI